MDGIAGCAEVSLTFDGTEFASGRAWSFTNVLDMLSDADRGFADIDVPRGVTLPRADWDIDTEYVLEGFVIGACDPTGAPFVSTLAGWRNNVAALRAVTARKLVAPYTWAGSLTVDGDVLTADVKLGGLKVASPQVAEVTSGDWAGHFSTVTLRAKILAPGWVTGS